jgi:RNase P subunit RPR2
MISKLLDAMFGCRHVRYSFPITVRAGSRRTATAQRTGTYVACLDCGKEFRYDWREMKIVGSRSREVAHSLVTKEATKEAA